MMSYQVIARKYRPQTFAEVIGQEALVTTLINAIKFNRLAQAYLFSGGSGTGKTTLARVFAKALNCLNINHHYEPCNTCASCKEIAAGNSLDVLEIDGASHRGIDDIRQISETISFSPSGKYKIYLIDEVHMLTKEAFNALLKILEEPPPQVLFFFATTEPHRIPATILSRCQRLQVRRISQVNIIHKLTSILQELKRQVTPDALTLIAERAEGSLRAAESLLDQALSFHTDHITTEMLEEMLGLAPSSLYTTLDQAVKENRLAAAFEISHQLFIEGKDFFHFVDGLIDHFRRVLRNCLMKKEGLYTQDEAVSLLEYLIEARQEMKNSIHLQITLETILLHIIQIKKRLSIETLVDRLESLNKQFKESPTIAPKGKDETLMRFAAVELEGTLQVKRNE